MMPTTQNAHTNTQQWLLGREKKNWGLEIAKENCLLGGEEKTKNRSWDLCQTFSWIFFKREREHV